jgi:hypothetical protein
MVKPPPALICLCLTLYLAAGLFCPVPPAHARELEGVRVSFGYLRILDNGAPMVEKSDDLLVIPTTFSEFTKIGFVLEFPRRGAWIWNWRLTGPDAFDVEHWDGPAVRVVDQDPRGITRVEPLSCANCKQGHAWFSLDAGNPNGFYSLDVLVNDVLLQRFTFKMLLVRQSVHAGAWAPGPPTLQLRDSAARRSASHRSPAVLPPRP